MAALQTLFSTTLLLTVAHAITAVPSQTDTVSSSMTRGAALASPTSYSFAFTVTQPTTAWQAPTFATPAPLPPCTDKMCPNLDGKSCIDSLGHVYGVLCDTRFSGVVLTNSGKKLMMEKERRDDEASGLGSEMVLNEGGVLEKRDFTGTFDGCAGYCDTMFQNECLGVAFAGGYCMAFDAVSGTFNAPGEIAALRQ